MGEMLVMTKIFVDTWFIVALINKRDQYHQKALQLAEQYKNHPLITTDTIFLEFGNALSSNYKNEAAELIEQFLASDEVDVIHLTPELFGFFWLCGKRCIIRYSI
jgi:predicted nucleic acid-binding protein